MMYQANEINRTEMLSVVNPRQLREMEATA